jgi:hypothetical protein
MNDKEWKSNARWPINKERNGHPLLQFSMEYHATKEQADLVCKNLNKYGTFCGDEQVFPLETWTSKRQEGE